MLPSTADRKTLEAAKRVRAKQRRHRNATKPPRVEKAGQEPRKRDTTYLKWIRRLPCIACLATNELTQTFRQIEAAHVRAGYPADGWRPTGMSEKPSDRRTVPLCREHHREGPKAQHNHKERLWWDALGIHPPEFCAALSKAYDESRDGSLVVQLFASNARVNNVKGQNCEN